MNGLLGWVEIKSTYFFETNEIPWKKKFSWLGRVTLSTSLIPGQRHIFSCLLVCQFPMLEKELLEGRTGFFIAEEPALTGSKQEFTKRLLIEWTPSSNVCVRGPLTRIPTPTSTCLSKAIIHLCESSPCQHRCWVSRTDGFFHCNSTQSLSSWFFFYLLNQITLTGLPFHQNSISNYVFFVCALNCLIALRLFRLCSCLRHCSCNKD